MSISKHISYLEATRSQTAIRLGIQNTPNLCQLNSMKLLAEKVFEPLRCWLGKPIIVSSFFRSDKLNTAIKGSKTSQHCKGEAIDIVCDRMPECFDWIRENLEFDQLIWEFGTKDQPSWIHVSYREKDNRKMVLRATNSGYEKFD